MWANPQFPVDLVTFIEEILNGKLHFLCSVSYSFTIKGLCRECFKILCIFSLFQKILIFLNEHEGVRGHPLSTYPKFSEKLTFLTVRIRGLEMLVFRKILRTYVIDGPLWRLIFWDSLQRDIITWTFEGERKKRINEINPHKN